MRRVRGGREPRHPGHPFVTDDELLELYAVLVGGRVLVVVGESVVRSASDPVTTLVALLAALAGSLAVFSAIVATAHEVLAES